MHCLPAHRDGGGHERGDGRAALGGLRRGGEPAARAEGDPALVPRGLSAREGKSSARARLGFGKDRPPGLETAGRDPRYPSEGRAPPTGRAGQERRNPDAPEKVIRRGPAVDRRHRIAGRCRRRPVRFLQARRRPGRRPCRPAERRRRNPVPQQPDQQRRWRRWELEQQFQLELQLEFQQQLQLEFELELQQQFQLELEFQRFEQQLELELGSNSSSISSELGSNLEQQLELELQRRRRRLIVARLAVTVALRAASLARALVRCRALSAAACCAVARRRGPRPSPGRSPLASSAASRRNGITGPAASPSRSRAARPGRCEEPEVDERAVAVVPPAADSHLERAVRPVHRVTTGSSPAAIRGRVRTSRRPVPQRAAHVQAVVLPGPVEATGRDPAPPSRMLEPHRGGERRCDIRERHAALDRRARYRSSTPRPRRPPASLADTQSGR